MASGFWKSVFLVVILISCSVGSGKSELDCLNVPASEFVGSVRSTIEIIRQVISIVSEFAGVVGDFRLSNAVSDCLDLMDLSVDQLSSTLSVSQNPKGTPLSLSLPLFTHFTFLNFNNTTLPLIFVCYLPLF